MSAALATLKELDPHIFSGPPSEKLMARLMVGPGPVSQDTWTQAACAADYMNQDQRRQAALKILRHLALTGEPIPTEDSVRNLPSRDESMREQNRVGGGALNSAAANVPMATRTSLHNG